MGVVVALVGLLRTMAERGVQNEAKVGCNKKTRKQNDRKKKQLKNDEEEKCTVKKY